MTQVQFIPSVATLYERSARARRRRVAVRLALIVVIVLTLALAIAVRSVARSTGPTNLEYRGVTGGGDPCSVQEEVLWWEGGQA